MAPTHNDNITTTTNSSQLQNNKIYTHHFPNFIISLTVLYVFCFLIRFIIRKYRRMRERKQQQEIRRLKQAWIHGMKKQQFKDSLLFEQQEKVIIDFPPSTYNESFHSTLSSSTLNSPTTLCNNNSHCNFNSSSFIQERSLSTTSSTSSSSSRTIGLPNPYFFNNNKKMTKKVLQEVQQTKPSHYWKINNIKRLNILWQWSVSMGYVDYQHAKDLNLLIDELSTKKKQTRVDSDNKENHVTTTVVDYLEPPSSQETITQQ